MGRNYQGSGAKSDNEISREISKSSWYKTNETIRLNDKYRAYVKTVPEGEQRMMTFLEFKKTQKPPRKKLGRTKR